jgi:CubicO group peptidase (beta-lactamase class C family)
MLHMYRRRWKSRAWGRRPRLFSLAALVGLIVLQTPLTAPAQAKHSTLSLSSPAVLGDPRELETFLDGVIGKQMRVDHVPGVTVAVVKDGQLFFTKGYGAADLQADKPVNAQTTLFRIGSVSKVFTATAVLQLAEQGKLDLHADVNTYLKTFHIPATYPRPITLADLLTHTAGFEGRDTGLQLARTTGDLEPLGRLLAEHMPVRVRPPGELTAYSNYGYALAGYIVEQVSGMPLADYAEQHIFQPLDMRSSTFRQPVEARLAAGLSKGYVYGDRGYRPDPFETIAVSPAGAMSVTATDMANFMIAQLQNGRFGDHRILQDSTAAMMQTRQITNDPRAPGGMAYGFEAQERNGQRLLIHPGGVGAFFSLLALLPEQHVGVFVAYNSFGGAANILSYPFLQAFLDHYTPASETPLPTPPAGSAERTSRITGSYWGTDRSDTTWEKLIDSLIWGWSVSDAGNGRLKLSWLLSPLAPGVFGPPVTFVEVAPWVFHQVDGQETIVFRPDPGGMRMMRSSYPVMAFDQVAWYATPTFVLALTLVCLLIFLSTLLLWSLGFTRRALRRVTRGPIAGQKADKAAYRSESRPSAEIAAKAFSTSFRFHVDRGNLPQLASGLVGALSALNVLLVVVVLFFLFQQLTGAPPAYYYGAPPLLNALFALALVSVVLTVGVVILAIPVWWERFWSVGRRVHYSLVALAALALTWQLAYWNLLGFRA